MDFKIVDVFTHDGQLVVKAEHYHATGPFWFTEHYTWQGREGLKRQRRVNALGEPLLDNGAVAPTRIRPGRPGEPNQTEPYVPVGRQWGYNDRPRLTDNSILQVIAATHRQRLATGWPQGQIDRLGSFKPNYLDEAGRSILLPHFQHLIGRAV